MTVKQGEHNSSDSGSSCWAWAMHQLLWDRPDPLQTERTQERGHVCSALGCICPWWTLTSARQTTLEAAALPLAQPEPISGWPVGFHRWQTAGGGRFPGRYFGDSKIGSHAVLTVAPCINRLTPTWSSGSVQTLLSIFRLRTLDKLLPNPLCWPENTVL